LGGIDEALVLAETVVVSEEVEVATKSCRLRGGIEVVKVGVVMLGVIQFEVLAEFHLMWLEVRRIQHCPKSVDLILGFVVKVHQRRLVFLGF